MSSTNDIDLNKINNFLGEKPIINIQCSNKGSSSGSSVATLITKTILGMIIVLFIVTMLIIVVGCFEYALYGPTGFSTYWNNNMQLVKTIIGLTSGSLTNTIDIIKIV